MVRAEEGHRLPFMAFERGVEWERPGAKAVGPPPKLPSLNFIINSVQQMKFSEGSLSTMSKGSLRSNPSFGGSGLWRSGPKLPIKHSKRRLQALLKPIRRAKSPGPNQSKKGKRAGWAGLETHEFSVDAADLADEGPVQEPAPTDTVSSDADTDSSLSSGSSSTDDSDDLMDTSDEEEARRISMQKRGSGLTRRMSAFAMMLPLLDHNNQPVRRRSVAEAFLQNLEGQEEEEDSGSLDFPWSDEECRSVFIKFDTDTDGEVATEELELMLRYMGSVLRPGEVEKLIKDMFSYATVSWEEWMSFLEKYREADEQYLREAFAAADDDGNGVLDVQELRALLTKMGYVTEAHTVQEALETIGCAHSGHVNLRKFEKLREHLRCTEGLAKDDVTELRDFYDRMAVAAKAQNRARRVDAGAGSQSDIAKKLIAETQELPVEDVWRLVQYCGYSISEDKLQSITKEVDNDHSGFISFQELLKLIRRVRDTEREAISSVFEFLAEGGTKLPLQDLPRALVELKYFASDDVIFSILDELYPLDSEPYLTHDGLASFLRVFREKEGMTQQETAEIREIFDNQCKVTSHRAFVAQMEDPSSPKLVKESPWGGSKLQQPRPRIGSMSPAPSPKASPQINIENAPIDKALDWLQASRVMRWFGIVKRMPEVQAMVEQFDMDGTGKLDFEGFLKLMRKFVLEEREKQWGIFTMLDSRGNGHVPVSRLPYAISKLYDDTEAGMSKRGEQAARLSGFSLLDTKNSVSRSAFELFCKHYRRLHNNEIRQHSCYSRAEVHALRDCFNRFDKDKSGTVENSELAKIIAEYFPEATKSKEGRAEVQIILKDIDQDGTGCLKFEKLLVLMRRCDDIRDEKDLSMEMQVVEELGLDYEEVEGFRQIFALHANWVKELSFDSLLSIISFIADMDEDNVSLLSSFVREAHPENRLVLRFSHFLRVMRRLTDENIGNINNACSRVLKKQAQRGSILTSVHE